MNSCEQAQKAISSAKVFMLIKLPFFGVLVTKLKDIPDPTTSTIATDGVNLYYNPDFINNVLKTREKIIFALLHEVLHLVFGHLYRKGARHFMIWNEACDYAVNGAIYQYQQLLGSNKKYFQMGDNILFSFEFLDKSAEEIYSILKKKRSSSDNLDKFNQSLFDSHDKWLSRNFSSVDEIQWKHFVKSVLRNTKYSQNILPGCITTYVDEFFLPKKNWKQELSNFIEPLEKDYGFSPPDRRYMLYDFFMPFEYFYDEGIRNVYFYVDCSGSVNDTLVKEFVSEVRGCYDQFSVKSEIYFGTFDAEASSPILLSDDYVLDIKGRGSTNPSSVFLKLEQLQLLDQARLIIILTDGYFAEMPKSIANDVPVLWVVSQDGIDDNIKKSGWKDIIYL